MLEVLRIQNYALIDELEIELGPGFNVLTGETGAGKSIIVGALNLVLGGRASTETVREGAKQAKIDAVFRIAKPSKRLAQLLRQHDIACENDELFLSRVITAEGRSRAYICGSLVPVSLLAEVGDELVDIHGQHEHQSLLKPDRQLDLLDAFAGTENLANEVGESVAKLRELNKAIADLEVDDRERARRIDFLRYEVAEIDAAGLAPGEEEDLKARRNLIDNAERIVNLATHARSAIYDDDEKPAVVQVDAALADFYELIAIDDRFKPLAEQLAAARTAIDDVAGEIRKYTDGLDFDPQELERLNERLALIGDLKRKYGTSIQAILEYREKCQAEIEAYEVRDETLLEMRTRRDQLLKNAQQAAENLSKRRRAATTKLDKAVSAALHELGMKGGAFQTEIQPVPLASTGIDKAEFLLTANPGEKLKPLRQVASGGEISRIMLALKAVFAEADKISALIFDEIDAGVGGHIARNVASKMRELAKSHQTICITHIAQIAAAARQHYHVAKSSQKGRTTTTVARVEHEQRVEEIARLLDGSATTLSLEHARELLAKI